MDRKTDRTTELGLTRRHVLKATAAMSIAGGVSLGSGTVGATNGNFNDLCEAVPLDVMLVLDRSGSMGIDPDGDGNSKLDDVKSASTAFVGRLTSTDRVGLVSFNSTPTLDDSMTGDFSGVQSSISALSAGGGTNIAAAVDLGHNHLNSHGRVGATPVLVVLSNGITFTNAAVTEANEAKDDGIRVVTISFGQDGNDSLMQAMASEPKSDNYHDAPTGADIDGVFETITQEICPKVVEIDIKPGSDPNALNCGAEGVVPVAILTTSEFDATTVDPSTLRFGSPSEIVGGGGANLAHDAPHSEDVDDDGDTDVVAHFPTPDTGFTKSDTEGWLVGETNDGRAIAGRHSVKVVGNCR